MNAIRLKTEYLTHPVGIDILKPRLFWKCEGGTVQTAYHVVAESNGDIIWDTGKISSSTMSGIPWAGPALYSKSIINWRVRLWDETDIPGEWSTASFEMGLLHETDWKSTWITGDYLPKNSKRYPVDYFRNTFTCNNPHKARLYITACGLYEAHLNGKRVGDFIMAPGFTCYNKRMYYQTYDVTALLINGENTLEIALADGWYRGSIGAMGVRNVYGRQTKLLAQLELVMSDGRSQVITTDGSWQWSDSSSYRFADMKDGEMVDLRKSPVYSRHAKTTSCKVTPTASNNVIVKEHERFTSTLSKTPSGKLLFDFGQNIAGYIELNLTASDDQKIFMQFAEHLNDTGEVDMEAMQCHPGKPNATPKQEVSLICKEGINHYKTKFAVFGFRYVSVVSEMELTPANITAIAVYSDMEQTSVFECSNHLINRFVENTRWSMKSNFLDVPTDCPTRERSPWTGDVQIFCKTGTYLMDTAPFLRKWLQDLRDRQGKDGKVPCHAPDVRNNEFIPGIDFISRMDGCCGWADSAVLVPLGLYEMYRDQAFLLDSYQSMKAHTLFQIGRTGRTGLFGKPFPKPDKKYISNVGQAFGEWLEAKDVYQQSVMQDFCAPHPEEATAYLSYICGIMAKVARKLGFNEDIPLYEEYHERCKTAYINQFTPVNTDRQSKLVRPLALNLLTGVEAQKTFDRLITAIERRDYRIGTGFLSTPLILPLLTRMGRPDVAYKMMENEEEPGWLYEVKKGATTVWENWDATASQNHYSPGSVCQWLFETVCGIKVTEENYFTIAPQPGGTLTYASFSYDSIYGKVICAWHKNETEVNYSISIPANTSAKISLPDGTVECVTAGTWQFSHRAYGTE